MFVKFLSTVFNIKNLTKRTPKSLLKVLFFSLKYILEKLTYFWRVSVHTHTHTHTVYVYSPDFFKYMRLEPSYHCKHRNCWKPELETVTNWSTATYKVFLFNDKLRTIEFQYLTIPMKFDWANTLPLSDPLTKSKKWRCSNSTTLSRKVHVIGKNNADNHLGATKILFALQITM